MEYFLYPLGVGAIVFGTYGLVVLINRSRKMRNRSLAKEAGSPESGDQYRNIAMESLEERRKMHGPRSIHDDFFRLFDKR